ncbi:ABC transporter ATP-binding protein, partial [Pseudonocardia sp. KRD-169]|nr:ABC transporter ATP-binding protein [Pseudonocardia abyssalis]
LAHLDAAERARIRRVIAAAVARAGVAALYVTHDHAEAMAVADRLAVLRDGEVVQTDTPARVYHHPVDVFVAEVAAESGIGLLPARVVVADGFAGFAVGARRLPLWAPPPAGLVDGRRVVLGLRAEVVGVAGPGADPGAVRLPVTVGRVEHAGHRATVVGEVSVPGDADGARLVARTAEPPRPGERAEFVVDARRAHVFDAVTGRALLHPGVTP